MNGEILRQPDFEEPILEPEAKFEKELSLEEKINTLENSDLSIDKKLDLVLLLLDRKLATQLGNYKVFEGESEVVIKEIREEFLKEFITIKETLDKLKLKYNIVNDLQERDGIYGFSFLVAKDQSILLQFIDAHDKKNDRDFGSLVGYPKTAIESYRTNDAFDYHSELSLTELDQLKQEGLIPFLHFMPSRNHWREELEFARDNARIVKEKSPTLFGQLIKLSNQ